MNLNSTDKTASKTFSFTDGAGQVYIKVVDKAGNTGYLTTPITYKVDTKDPDVCTLSTVDGVALTGSKLINGSNDVIFTVNASDYNDNYITVTTTAANGTTTTSKAKKGDDVTKIASVNLYRIGTGDSNLITAENDEIGKATLSNGTTGDKTGVWKIKIPASRFTGKTSGSFPVSVIVTDTFNKSKEFQLFTLDIDNEKPTIKNYTLESVYDAGMKPDQISGNTGNVKTYYMNNICYTQD